MTKYFIALFLFTVMVSTIAMIDARSSGLGGAAEVTGDASQPTDKIYASGVVEGRTEEIDLRPEQVGRVMEVLVSPGECVRRGDILIRMDNARQLQEVNLAAAHLKFAEAELEQLNNGARAEEREEAHALHRAATARLEQAVRTWNRMEQLRSQRAVSEQDVEEQQALVDSLQGELDAAESRVRQIEAPARADEMRSAAARVTAAQAELDLAQISLTKTELRAPSDGCVLDVNIEPGELTGPNATEPLVVLSDTSSIRVRAFVEELDAPRVQIGMSAQVTADGIPDTTFEGRVVSISPYMSHKSIDAGRPDELFDTKVREVVLELEAASRLIVGLRVDVSFDVVHEATADVNQ